MLRVLFRLSFALLVFGCGSGQPESPKQSSSKNPTGTPGLNSGDSETEGETEAQESAATKGLPEDGRAFFTQIVSTQMRESCESCHSASAATAVRGPLSIFSYVQTKSKLESSQTIDDSPFFLISDLDSKRLRLANQTTFIKSELVQKMIGTKPHKGGIQCSAPDAGICKTILEWWKREFGETGLEGIEGWQAGVSGQQQTGTGQSTSNADARSGAIVTATALGKIIGWAANKSDLDQQVEVRLYLGGPSQIGTLLGSVMANEAGVNGGHSGRHQFSYQLPDQYLDGEARTIYLYGVLNGEEIRLDPNPTQVSAWKFSEEGRQFFEASVRPRLNACQSCHQVGYEQQFYSLISPSPAEGATARNNELINKPSLSNGESHRGGRRCSSVAASPCKEIMEWWEIEFGR